MNYLKRLLGFGTSVDAILGDFNKTIARLRAHADSKALEAEAHDVVLNKVRALKFAAENEITRAKIIAGKFTDLTCTNTALKQAA